MAQLYEINGLEFDYSLGSQKVPALRGIELTIGDGEFVCLAGPSGSGKSTLLHILGLIERIQHGSVRFLDQDLRRLSEAARNRMRRFELGFVFQQFHLLPVLSVMENVEYFLTRQKVSRRARAERVRAALDAVGLWEQRRRRPFALSVGQRQRVAVARAIAKQPRVIIADEPTASLDQETGRQILEILRNLNRSRGITLILASHDPMVHGMVDRLIRLRDGRIAVASDRLPTAAQGDR